MKIRILSDLHLEFGNLDIPVTSDEKDTVCVLAGDIGVASKQHSYKLFIEEMSDRFLAVVYVLGNHEHYHGKFSTTYPKIDNELIEYDNVYLLEKEVAIIDGVAFVGATLWADYNHCNTMTIYDAGLWMNDHKCIRHGPPSAPWQRKFSPNDAISDHLNAKHFIFKEIETQSKAGRKVVVVTHHCPSFQSIPEMFKNSNLNGAYASEFTGDIMDMKQQPVLWIHGHVHNSNDYMIDNTRVISNPRGYTPSDVNPNFNPIFDVDI